jgi:hypothetical protein
LIVVGRVNMSIEPSLAIPESNIKIFTYLYSIETAIREIILEKLANIYGHSWYKRALPGGEILTKYKNARVYEKLTPWVQYVPHNPIYYLDFPDLTTIIERNDNWNAVFKDIFYRKDFIVTTLRELEPIRNKVAHNRKAATKDLEIVIGAYRKISAAIGEAYMTELIMRCTSAEDLPKNLAELQKEAYSALTACINYRPLTSLNRWKSVSKEWWFNSDYLNNDITPVEVYFGTLERYDALPRPRGSGYQIEHWVKEEAIQAKYANAVGTLETTLKEFGK